MFEQVLQEIRSKIRLSAYVVTIHADEEMDDDNLAMSDVAFCILGGEIIERQRDRVTGESKYRIRGMSLDGLPVETIVKLGATGKVVIITVYAL
jgi:GTP-sensing pleiotropic transcriptional regulator CodY